MSLNLYFVRHGQSVANVEKRCFYNEEGSPLTILGREQAAQAGKQLRRVGGEIDAILCSPYKRARETCEIALAEIYDLKRPILIDQRVGERRFDGMVGEIVTREYHLKTWDVYSDFSAKNGIETLPALEKRARNFLEDMKRKYDGGTIFVFSHGGFGLMLYAVLAEYPADGLFYNLKFPQNGEVINYKY